MSRPKPTVLLEHATPKTGLVDQVLKADAIYAVFFEGEPINLRKVAAINDYPPPKYKKVSFSNAGHAFNLAEKLNKMYACDKFEVYRLTQGEAVREDRGA